MYICSGNTFWSYLFSFSEIVSIAFLAYLYTKYTLNIRKTNEIENYENLDLIIIFLSIFQVYLMLFSLVFSNNFGFSILQEISKFTQNMIICGCLLLQIFLWQKYPIAIYIIKNYVYIFTLFNFFILLCGFFLEYSFLEVNFCYSIILKILPVLGFTFNLLLIAMAIYNNYQEQNESRKNGALIYENDNLGAIIDKYASSLQKMRKYYLIFIVYFTVSYFVDVYFKFSNIKYDDAIYNYAANNPVNNASVVTVNNKTNGFENISNFDKSYKMRALVLDGINSTADSIFAAGNGKTNAFRKLFYGFSVMDLKLFDDFKYNYDNVIVDNNRTDVLFGKDFDLLVESSRRILIEDENIAKNNPSDKNDENKINNPNRNVFITRYISACEYYKDLGDKYSFKELLVCFISFIFRDIGPHIYILISLFIYKPETLSRSSSFIEI